MNAHAVALAEVEPLYAYTEAAAAYRRCDFCYAAAYEDAWAGRPWRLFYEVLGEHGLVVCEFCLPRLWEE